MDGERRRNIKRKRYEPPEEDLSVKIGGKLHHELRESHHASKKAKSFEIQKLVKRLKELRRKDGDASIILEHEEQLTSLKAIDHDLVGNTALKTKIMKNHTLRNSELVQTAVAKELEPNLITPAPTGTTLAKVQSRLFSSKILATQVTTSVESLRHLLNPDLPRQAPTLQGPQKLGARSKQKDVTETTDLDMGGSDEDEETQGKVEGEVEDENGPEVEDRGWESGTVNENELDASTDEWQSGSFDDTNGSPGKRFGGQDNESSSDDDEVVPPPKKVTKIPSSARPSTSGVQSTFLPSLSVGYIRGSDDSDLSDDDTNAADPRKNRRGQRARRAIWEKKYGRNANHKKKEAIETKALDKSNDRRPGPKNISSRSSRTSITQATRHTAPRSFSNPKAFPSHQQIADSGWGQRQSGTSRTTNVQPTFPTPSYKSREKTTAKPLHPSWEAKRKLKEKQSESIVPSQGKKIKF